MSNSERALKLKGSCHCGAVKFELASFTPYPFMHCYCSICRKTAGGGGYAINIMGDSKTLKVTGKGNLAVYRAKIRGKPGHGRRHFCKKCGSALWVWDPRWGSWIYPFASAIDTPLPKPRELQHILLDYAAPWVDVPRGERHRRFAQFPPESIEGWHKKRGLYGKQPKPKSR